MWRASNEGDPQGDPGGIRGGSGSKKGDPRHSRHFKTTENRGIHCMQLALSKRVPQKLKQGDPQGDPGGIQGGSRSKKGDPRQELHCKTNENRGIHCNQLAAL